jgi:hypothetical protein
MTLLALTVSLGSVGAAAAYHHATEPVASTPTEAPPSIITWEDGSWAYVGQSLADLPGPDALAVGEVACLGEPGEPYSECATWDGEDWTDERPY